MHRLLLLALLASPLHAQEWPRFRGPNGSGTSDATTIPTVWTADTINWSTPLLGIGNGSPVLWGTNVFLLAEQNDGATRIVTCVDGTSGEIRWTRSYEAETHKKHKLNTFASSTPACDAERVYVGWGTPEAITLRALTHDGEDVWERDLGPFKAGHGYAVSPMVHGDLVVIGNDQEAPSSLFALDRRTGETVWQIERPKAQRATYSTPCVWEPIEGKPELVFTNWQHGMTGVDPATGEQLWEKSVFDTSRSERAIGSPIVAGDLVIGSCGFTTAEKQLVALRRTPDGVQEAYKIERNVPHIPTPLYHAGRLYLWGDKGVLACHDAADGKLLWQGRVGGNVFGSPVCVDGRLFCVDDVGTVVVAATGDEFRELARYDLGEGCKGTPAIANGTLYVRTYSKLFSIGGPQ
jgi:outer membrane protein assembly factor BamB